MLKHSSGEARRFGAFRAPAQRLAGGRFVFKRVGLFVLTNLAVLLVLGVVMAVLRALGVFEGVNFRYGPVLIMAAVFGFGGAFVSLLMSKWIAKRATGARVIDTPRTPLEGWLVETVHRQARQAGIGLPEVAIYDAPDMNAFATGASRRNALVAVSSGLLQGMDRDQVEAVLAHEVSHVANGDMVTLTLIQGVLNTFVIFASRVVGDVVDRAVFRSERGRGPAYWIVTMVAEFFLAIGATIIVMWFSRYREFRADAGGAGLAGPHQMIAALRRLGRSAPSQLPDSMMAFGIRNGKFGGLASLFRSHPPLEDRIARLQASLQRG
ncbi:MAG TPA: protease HtpX [Polyangiaceae bacterium]|nr:protease HtpX [Polyangiaceae bacterium]